MNRKSFSPLFYAVTGLCQILFGGLIIMTAFNFGHHRERALEIVMPEFEKNPKPEPGLYTINPLVVLKHDSGIFEKGHIEANSIVLNGDKRTILNLIITRNDEVLYYSVGNYHSKSYKSMPYIRFYAPCPNVSIDVSDLNICSINQLKDLIMDFDNKTIDNGMVCFAIYGKVKYRYFVELFEDLRITKTKRYCYRDIRLYEAKAIEKWNYLYETSKPFIFFNTK